MTELDLDPKLTFDTFVVGASNRLACAAARRVAEAPGSTYNPLFVYSASGLGKTHLVMAIGHAARQTRGDLRMAYHTLAHLMDEVTSAIESGERDVFRAQLADVDLLLVDDVQFLAGRYQMQEELLRVWDGLLARDGQVVLASDRPPQEMDGLDERLLSRFSGGLIMDIATPDYETRVAILRRKAEDRGAELEDGVPEALARLAFRNVRELQGALNRVLAVQDLEERAVTPAEVPDLLDELAEAQEGDEFADFLGDLTGTLSEVVAGPLPQPPSGYDFDGLALAEDLFAVRAAAAVADEPGTKYNPLYVHGGDGAGKSTLLAALGNELRTRYPDRPVGYVEGEVFAEELIEALERDHVDGWRARYRRAGVLLVDDVDALQETERAQEEMFHLFDALHHSGAQLVFTGDRAPRELSGIEERLRTRLESGLVVELDPVGAGSGATADDGSGSNGRSGVEAGAGAGTEAGAGSKPGATGGGAEANGAGAGGGAGSTGGAGSAGSTGAAGGGKGAAAAGRARGSDVDADGDRWFANAEKVVWDWPYPEHWLAEELE